MEEDPFTPRELYELQRRRDWKRIAIAASLFSVLATLLALAAIYRYPALMG